MEQVVVSELSLESTAAKATPGNAVLYLLTVTVVDPTRLVNTTDATVTWVGSPWMVNG